MLLENKICKAVECKNTGLENVKRRANGI